jgi:type III restriction enzyme
MFTLIEFQEKAVNTLLEYTFEALGETQPQTKILLESPTGSGKTIMMAALIERVVEELTMQPNLTNNVAFIWFAPNTLHIQSFQSLQKLYADANKLNCIDLSNLSSNPILNHKDLLFVNWSSLDGKTKIWRKQNESNTNLETLIENTKAEGTKIILVIDEAHLGAFTGAQATAVRNLIEADIEILVTATPIFRPQRTVSISRKKVIKEQLIKKGVRINIGIDPEQQNGENVHIHLLRKAFEKKRELQLLFNQELGENVINPLILIQLPSDGATLTDEDKSLRETLEGLLNLEYSVSLNNGKLAVWLSGEKDKDGLEEMNGFQDVLIFKQAVSQGWDCPRACILVSYRRIGNQSFGIQTVGRILRMPHQRHYINDDLNYGYVYTDIETNRINFTPNDQDYFDIQIAERRENKGWTFDKITASTIVNDRPSPGILTNAFEKKFFAVMEQRYSISQLPNIDLFTPENQEIVRVQMEQNKQALIQNGWEFVIDEHQIHLPANIQVDPYEVNSIVLNNNQVAHFAITTAQIGELFDKFCYDNITRLNRSKSWKKLRETLVHFAEFYLGIFEFEARKIYMHPQNQVLLVQHIATALENFDNWQRAKGNDKKRVVATDWEVPEMRYYSEHFTRQDDVESHALDPFFEQNSASNPEKAFKDFLLRNENHIEWWYKNGDTGREHFAVDYRGLNNELKLFYVDFVVKFNSGKIGLFDTKTKNFDNEASNKHNALFHFIKEQNEKDSSRIFVGGIVIPEENAGVINFRFPEMEIDNTGITVNWTFLNPAQL